MKDDLQQNNIEVSVPQDISDDQLDKFFEKGGDASVFEQKSDEADTNEQPTEVQSTKEEAQEAPKVEPTQTKDDPTIEERRFKAAMYEERERRQALQAQVLKMEERFQQFVQKAQEPQVKEPSYDEDPLEALRIKSERLEQIARYQLEQEQRRLQAEGMRDAERQFVGRYQGDAQTFAQRQQDFPKAYEHLMRSRLEEYKSAGYNDAESQHLLIEDEKAIVAKAYHDGVNPAERLYSVAKLRGYQHKAEATQAPAPTKEAQKFQQVQKGIEASRSLSNGGSSGSPNTDLSLKSLADMDDDEFDKLSPAQWKRAMGG